MESPQKTISRLLTALETLTSEEEHLFAVGSYEQSTAVQQRAMPVATKIAGLLVGPGVAQSLDPALQTRIQKLLTARRAHYDQLTTRLQETDEKLKRLAAANVRIRRVKPVYGDSSAVASIASFAAEG